MASFASCAQAQDAALVTSGEKMQVQMQIETERWMNAVFGHCFETVRKKPFLDYSVSLNGNWTKLREDALKTQNLQLFDAYESPEGNFTIIDKNQSGSSCWTQFSTLRPKLAFQAFDAIVTPSSPSDNFVILDEKKLENDGTQRIYLYNPKDGNSPIIVYQARMVQPRLSNIVTIVKIADITEKKKD